MKVLYVGGTGEISYECVRRDVELGRDVAVFNRGANDEPLPQGVRHIRGDLSDDAAYAALGREDWDVVCQFLVYDIGRARRDAEVFAGRCGQYVFISSASAYRKPVQGYVITEQTPLENPYWPYSRAKIEIEQFLQAEHRAGRLPVTVVRPSHTYRRHLPSGIAGGDDWAWRMRNHRPVIVHGDGTSLWTLTRSSDFAVPFCNLLGHRAAVGEAFHITRHMEGFTWNEITAAMGRALGVEPVVVHVPTETLCRYRPDWAGPLLGDKTWSVLFDNAKVMSVAGAFECKVGLDEGMGLAAEHCRRRAAAFRPNEQLHALLDRIAADQQALGGPAAS